MYINKQIIYGNLGKDPELRSFTNGGCVCNVSVATTSTWRDAQSGEQKSKTEWHRVVFKNKKQAEIVNRDFQKGDKIYVEGRTETRSYVPQDGVQRSITELIASEFKYGENDKAKTNQTPRPQAPTAQPSQPTPQPAPQEGQNFAPPQDGAPPMTSVPPGIDDKPF